MTTQIRVDLIIPVKPEAQAAFRTLCDILEPDDHDLVSLDNDVLEIHLDAEVPYGYVEPCYNAITEFCEDWGLAGAVMQFQGQDTPVGPTPAARKEALVQHLQVQIYFANKQLTIVKEKNENQF